MSLFAGEYQGGPYVEILGTQGSNPLAAWKLMGPNRGGLQKVFDPLLKGFVYVSGQGCKMQLPKDERSSLGLTQPYLVLQVQIVPGSPFGVELNIADTSSVRRRVLLSSSFTDTKVTPLHSQVPLASVLKDVWLNLTLPMADLVASSFRGISFRSLESLTISGSARLRKVFTLRDAPSDSLLVAARAAAGEAYSLSPLPRGLEFPLSVESQTQVLDPRALSWSNPAGKPGTPSQQQQQQQQQLGNPPPANGSDPTTVAHHGKQPWTSNRRPSPIVNAQRTTTAAAATAPPNTAIPATTPSCSSDDEETGSPMSNRRPTSMKTQAVAFAGAAVGGAVGRGSGPPDHPPASRLTRSPGKRPPSNGAAAAAAAAVETSQTVNAFAGLGVVGCTWQPEGGSSGSSGVARFGIAGLLQRAPSGKSLAANQLALPPGSASLVASAAALGNPRDSVSTHFSGSLADCGLSTTESMQHQQQFPHQRAGGGSPTPTRGRRALSAQRSSANPGVSALDPAGSSMQPSQSQTRSSGCYDPTDASYSLNPSSSDTTAVAVAPPPSPPWPHTSPGRQRAQSGPARLSDDLLNSGLGDTSQAVSDLLPVSPSVARHGRRAVGGRSGIITAPAFSTITEAASECGSPRAGNHTQAPIPSTVAPAVRTTPLAPSAWPVGIEVPRGGTSGSCSSSSSGLLPSYRSPPRGERRQPTASFLTTTTTNEGGPPPSHRSTYSGGEVTSSQSRLSTLPSPTARRATTGTGAHMTHVVCPVNLPSILQVRGGLDASVEGAMLLPPSTGILGAAIGPASSGSLLLLPADVMMASVSKTPGTVGQGRYSRTASSGSTPSITSAPASNTPQPNRPPDVILTAQQTYQNSVPTPSVSPAEYEPPQPMMGPPSTAAQHPTNTAPTHLQTQVRPPTLSPHQQQQQRQQQSPPPQQRQRQHASSTHRERSSSPLKGRPNIQPASPSARNATAVPTTTPAKQQAVHALPTAPASRVTSVSAATTPIEGAGSKGRTESSRRSAQPPIIKQQPASATAPELRQLHPGVSPGSKPAARGKLFIKTSSTGSLIAAAPPSTPGPPQALQALPVGGGNAGSGKIPCAVGVVPGKLASAQVGGATAVAVPVARTSSLPSVAYAPLAPARTVTAQPSSRDRSSTSNVAVAAQPQQSAQQQQQQQQQQQRLLTACLSAGSLCYGSPSMGPGELDVEESVNLNGWDGFVYGHDDEDDDVLGSSHYRTGLAVPGHGPSVPSAARTGTLYHVSTSTISSSLTGSQRPAYAAAVLQPPFGLAPLRLQPYPSHATPQHQQQHQQQQQGGGNGSTVSYSRGSMMTAGASRPVEHLDDDADVLQGGDSPRGSPCSRNGTHAVDALRYESSPAEPPAPVMAADTRDEAACLTDTLTRGRSVRGDRLNSTVQVARQELYHANDFDERATGNGQFSHLPGDHIGGQSRRGGGTPARRGGMHDDDLIDDWGNLDGFMGPVDLQLKQRAYTPPIMSSKRLGTAVAGARGRQQDAQMLTVQHDQQAGAVARPSVMSGGGEETLELVFDPVLNCYYDARTQLYYELKG